MTNDRGLSADVAVIGLGAMGSMSLWRLAERGVDAIGFEQFDPGHDRGSSHGDSRAIRTAYFEDSRYVPLVRRSYSLWNELQRVTGDDRILVMTGMLSLGPPESEAVAGTVASAREHGLAFEMLDDEQMRLRHARHRLNAGDHVVYEEAAGVLRPELAILAAVGRAEALGARVVRQTRVTSIREAGGSVEIVAGDTSHRVRHVVVTVGAWLGGFLPDARLPLTIERQVMAWFPVPDAAEFLPDRFPIYLHDIGGGRMRYGFPTLDGSTIKVAVHHEGATTTPDELDREVHAADLAPLEAFVEHYLVGVEPRAVRAQACMYTNTPDFHFVVGSPPDKPWMTVLGGFSGHGFKFASVMGDAAAELATSGKSDEAFSLFAMDRFAANS